MAIAAPTAETARRTTSTTAPSPAFPSLPSTPGNASAATTVTTPAATPSAIALAWTREESSSASAMTPIPAAARAPRDKVR